MPLKGNTGNSELESMAGDDEAVFSENSPKSAFGCSRIFAALMQEIDGEKLDSESAPEPKTHYVKGAHTQGVYHKQYNRYS